MQELDCFPSEATSVGATVSWLMANCGVQTERAGGVRESEDHVSFSSLSHIMSGGHREGDGGVRCEFLAGAEGCADTLTRSYSQTKACLFHVGLLCLFGGCCTQNRRRDARCSFTDSSRVSSLDSQCAQGITV